MILFYKIKLFGFMGSEAHKQLSSVSTGLRVICMKEYPPSFLLKLGTAYQECIFHDSDTNPRYKVQKNI